MGCLPISAIEFYVAGPTCPASLDMKIQITNLLSVIIPKIQLDSMAINFENCPILYIFQIKNAIWEHFHNFKWSTPFGFQLTCKKFKL